MTEVKTKQTFLEAYLELQKELAPVSKDSTAKGTQFSYKYASLQSLKETVDPILYKHGFVVIQNTATQTRDMGRSTDLVTELFHVPTKEKITSTWDIKPVKDDPQGMGSALTYGRRYQYMVVCNLVAEDDDGASASTAPDRAPVKPTYTPPTEPSGYAFVKQGANEGKRYYWELKDGKRSFIKWAPEDKPEEDVNSEDIPF